MLHLLQQLSVRATVLLSNPVKFPVFVLKWFERTKVMKTSIKIFLGIFLVHYLVIFYCKNAKRVHCFSKLLQYKPY